MILFVWLANPLLRKDRERKDREFSFGNMVLSRLWGVARWSGGCKSLSEAPERNEIQDEVIGSLEDD